MAEITNIAWRQNTFCFYRKGRALALKDYAGG